MRTNRWTVSLAALALTALTACGGDTDEPSDSGSPAASASAGESAEETESAELTVLTEEQAQQALISEAVMGADFTAAPPTEDDSDSDLGCLDALDELDDIGADTKVEIEYTATSETELPTLENSVFSYAELEPVTARFEEIESALAGCDTVDVTDEEGTHVVLDVQLDSEVTAEGAEQQVTLEATGTVSSGDQEFPIAVYMGSVRVANHVTVVIYTDLPEDEAQSAATFDSYVDVATERLTAVAAGETPVDGPLA